MLTLLAVLGHVLYRRSLLLPTLLVSVAVVGSVILALLLGSGAPQVGSTPAVAPAPATLTSTPTATVTCSPGWTIYPNPAPAGESVLSGTVALAPNDLWAVGSYGSNPMHTLTVHGDGTTWTQVPSPDPAPGNNVILSGVAGVAGNDVWAVGSYVN